MPYKTSQIITYWILYPALSGLFVGIGHFAAYWLSQQLIKREWFKKNLMIQNIDGILYTQTNNIDIIEKVYEGGHTLWECTIDLLKLNIDYKGKVVLDMGCGLGLIGIQALKNQATKVIFQDYNESTQNILEQQLKLNFNPIPDHQFIFGDWDNITTEKIDIIVASEVIYREENYKKVINFAKRNLKENGKFFMINKNYYFGVGGSLQGFLDVCDLKVVDQIKFNQKGVKKTLLVMTL